MLLAVRLWAVYRACAFALAATLFVVSAHQAFAHSAPAGDAGLALEIAAHGHSHAIDDAPDVLAERSADHAAADHEHLLDLLPVALDLRAAAPGARVAKPFASPQSAPPVREKRPPRA